MSNISFSLFDDYDDGDSGSSGDDDDDDVYNQCYEIIMLEYK
jgi:hypothetical protein